MRIGQLVDRSATTWLAWYHGRGRCENFGHFSKSCARTRRRRTRAASRAAVLPRRRSPAVRLDDGGVRRGLGAAVGRLTPSSSPSSSSSHRPRRAHRIILRRRRHAGTAAAAGAAVRPRPPPALVLHRVVHGGRRRVRGRAHCPCAARAAAARDTPAAARSARQRERTLAAAHGLVDHGQLQLKRSAAQNCSSSTPSSTRLQLRELND